MYCLVIQSIPFDLTVSSPDAACSMLVKGILNLLSVQLYTRVVSPQSHSPDDADQKQVLFEAPVCTGGSRIAYALFKLPIF